MAHRGIKNGIAQKLQPLVVEGLPFVIPLADTLVNKGLTILFYMPWIKSKYLIECPIEILVLTKGKPKCIKKIVKPHHYNFG